MVGCGRIVKYRRLQCRIPPTVLCIRSKSGGFQLVEQDVEFGGFPVIEIGMIGESAVAVAVDDLEEERYHRNPR